MKGVEKYLSGQSRRLLVSTLQKENLEHYRISHLTSLKRNGFIAEDVKTSSVF